MSVRGPRGFGSTGLIARGRREMNLLSRRSVLAIAAVVDIALHSRPSPVAAKALAARHKLPPRHLETLLQGLVHAQDSERRARAARRLRTGARAPPHHRSARSFAPRSSLSTADPDDIGVALEAAGEGDRAERAHRGRAVPRQSRRHLGRGSLRVRREGACARGRERRRGFRDLKSVIRASSIPILSILFRITRDPTASRRRGATEARKS